MDTFTTAYIECALWSSVGDGPELGTDGAITDSHSFALTNACKAYSECDLYVGDDGKIYIL